MARTTGPLMSMSASGSLAGTLTYAHWKGRPYVRQLVTPANPKSQAQYYTRSMMRFLSQVWALLSPTAQAMWDDLAKQGNFSPFNAFVRLNMKRWTQALSPSDDPSLPGGGVAPVLGTLTPTGGVGQITGTQVLTTRNDGFGLVYSASLHVAGTSPLAAARLINQIFNQADASTQAFSITGLEPGTYDLSVRGFDEFGTAFTAAVSHASIAVT